MTSGFSFGNTAGSTTGTGGFGGSSGFSGFGATGNKNAAGAASTAGFGTAGLGAASTGFGAAGAAAGASTAAPTATPLVTPGFNFSGAANSTGLLAKPATTTAVSGLGGNLGGGFGAPPAKTAAPMTGGFGASTGLGGFGTTTTTATTTAGTGFGFSAGLAPTNAASKPALTLGAFNTTGAATTTAATGFGGFGGGLGVSATTSKSALTLGGFGATTGTSSGFSLGSGLGGTSSALTLGTSTSLFSNPAATTVSKGLGGVDPKKTTATTGISGANGKPGDSKAVKETAMPNEITMTVEDFKKYVKEQRNVREEIDRMSSKQMYKVQEEVAVLKQWLSLVSTGLQRNAIAIDKLKHESAQELKNAEIAQRTKDLPAGLQYENTAPTEYFSRMIDDFECRMVLYRQQIEEMENHLASLQQPAMLTPQELSQLLKKIYESFVHLAAQLQIIHEAVKAQKKQYLNYRIVFHGDSTDVFEKRRKAVEKARTTRCQKTVGPTPFTGISNAAAMAMATAMNRAQQPAGGAPALGLNTGLGTTGLAAQTGGLGTGLGTGIFGAPAPGNTGLTTGGFGSTGFGTSIQPTQPSAFGLTSFNFGAANTATVRPLGSTFGSTGSNAAGTGLFGASVGAGAGAGGGFGFGVPQTGFGTNVNTAGALNLSTTGGFGVASPDNKQPFLLQKPPAGNKKGKKT